jgi:hypothetical protein
MPLSFTVLWIRIGFNADLDLGAKPMQIQADPDPAQTLKSQNFKFFHEKYRYFKKVKGKKKLSYLLNKVNKHTYEGKKVYLKGRKQCLFVNCGRFPCSWIESAFLI